MWLFEQISHLLVFTSYFVSLLAIILSISFFFRGQTEFRNAEQLRAGLMRDVRDMMIRTLTELGHLADSGQETQRLIRFIKDQTVELTQTFDSRIQSISSSLESPDTPSTEELTRRLSTLSETTRADLTQLARADETLDLMMNLSSLSRKTLAVLLIVWQHRADETPLTSSELEQATDLSPYDIATALDQLKDHDLILPNNSLNERYTMFLRRILHLDDFVGMSLAEKANQVKERLNRAEHAI